MTMFNRFTERSRRVVILAQEEAKRFNHDYIGTEHILLGLIREGEGVAAAVLQHLGLSSDQIRLEVEKLVQIGPSTIVSGDLPFTPKAKKVIELAMDEARNLGHTYIGTEHLLLGLIQDEGVAQQVLQSLGLEPGKVRQTVKDLLQTGTKPSISFEEHKSGVVRQVKDLLQTTHGFRQEHQTEEERARLMAKPEVAENLATFAQNFYKALIARGFSEEQALWIVSKGG